ncbi:RIP metalloprotease RseP [Candidatus Blochmannia ocreatus (nom. nud.)]|uniref:Zinc metalloprotease n=1 Tax=Candidatus Blochmannia ocreatus (nom. nud.) TaxID=251538 RepID=A0ABY4SV25_9ENTR|nr:RIP metalloprotease RseP [Candidatus Blochmannia ocreatus]URJ25343.1 RIP metalloprotease RseP [Candidatus Blochmannia ocreatus]
MLSHFFWNLITFILTLSILITIHEYGHFLAARFLNVKIEKFSIGFGPVLWSWKDQKKDTEYAISAILFGGYIKLFDAPKSINKQYTQKYNNTFNSKKTWEKIIIIVAGPIMNFLLSIILYIIIFIIGTPTHKPIIQSIIPDSIADQSGLLSNLEIQSINNVHTHNWDAIRLEILNNIGKKNIVISTIEICQNNTNIKTYTLNIPDNWFNKSINYINDPVISLGIVPIDTYIIPTIFKIRPNSAAQQSGLKIGDKIIKINEQTITNWESVIKIIKNNLTNNLNITIARENKTINLNLNLQSNKIHCIHPNTIEEIIGFIPKVISKPTKNFLLKNKYGYFDAILHSCKKVWKLIYFTINTLFQAILGNINIIQLIGGPISIAQKAGETAKYGFIYYLMFLSVISINLGIINLLPFPSLDGGHLFFLIIEKIIGKLIPKKIKHFIHIIGYIILMSVISIALFNDINKLWQC